MPRVGPPYEPLELDQLYATSLYQDLVHAEFGGFPWEGRNFTTPWESSPLACVKNVATPL